MATCAYLRDTMSSPATLDASAVSSAAPEPSSSVDLASLSSDQMQHWRLTGEVPSGASTPDSPAGTSETDPAASTEAQAPPASDAGTSDGQTRNTAEPEYKARTAKRIEELTGNIRAREERIRALEAELASARKPSTPEIAAPATPSASAAAPAANLADFVAHPPADQPALRSDQFFQQFPDADFDDYTRYSVNHALAARDLAVSRRESEARAAQARTERINTFVERASAVAASLDPEVANLVPAELLPEGQTPNARNVLAQEIMLSENAGALLKGLTGADLAAVDRLTDVASVIRFVARLEARVAAAPAAAALPKRVSDAPAPTVEIGSRAKAPADPVEGAIAADDFQTFRELENKREIASGRR